MDIEWIPKDVIVHVGCDLFVLFLDVPAGSPGLIVGNVPTLGAGRLLSEFLGTTLLMLTLGPETQVTLRSSPPS